MSVLDELEKRLAQADISLEQAANDIARGKPGPPPPEAQKLLDRAWGFVSLLPMCGKRERRGRRSAWVVAAYLPNRELTPRIPMTMG